jgi:hypothetical protein
MQRRVVLREEPGEELLHSENAIQQERASETEWYETCRVLLAGHLHIRINRRYAIDERSTGRHNRSSRVLFLEKTRATYPPKGFTRAIMMADPGTRRR